MSGLREGTTTVVGMEAGREAPRPEEGRAWSLGFVSVKDVWLVSVEDVGLVSVEDVGLISVEDVGLVLVEDV